MKVIQKGSHNWFDSYFIMILDQTTFDSRFTSAQHTSQANAVGSVDCSHHGYSDLANLCICIM